MTAVPADDAPKKKRQIPGFAQLQRVGRSLMLPIAVLPAAALLQRFGQPDMLGADGLAQFAGWLQPVADTLGAAGSALFDNLPIIFAVGVAIGFAKKADGSTALAAVVGYLVLDQVFSALAPAFGSDSGDGETVINYGVLGGIIIGIVTALLYQRYRRIKLPTYLGFFGGRRFVPIVTSVAAMLIAVVMALVYPVFDTLINKGVGGFLMEHGSNPGTGFVFGTVNRLLIPFGLHHLLNNLPWFQLGSCTNSSGETLHGDITCFYSGVDGTAAWTGSFMTGFFPIMMFALPAAALAIYPHGSCQPSQGRRRCDAVGGSDRLHHRHHRAARIRLRLCRLPAVRGPRRAHRHLAGTRQRPGHQVRVRVLGRRHRLCAQLGPGLRAVRWNPSGAAAHRHRPRVRAHLLLPLPLGHHQVQPAHARP
jgi:PTS system N-acetylglucosamine-specific IIC component